MKKFFSLLLPIIAIVLIVGGTYFYINSGSEKIKNEHSKYVSLINDDHDFGAGLKGLESLSTEKAKSVLSNIENEIETATELKSIDESLKNADIDSAENHLDTAKQIDTTKTFSKATNWFNTEISNYKKAVEEINELDINSEDYDTLLKNIVEKYHFNYESIKKKLLGNRDNDEKSSDSEKSEDKDNADKKSNESEKEDKEDKEKSKDKEKTKETKTQKSSQSKKSSTPNTQVHPQIYGQQTPETYNTLRYTQEGSASRNIVENELKGDISNFSNEEINAAIARYNAKNQG